MEDTALIKVFRRLSQGSKQSVQSGKELDAFDKYMHVDRPIDKVVRDAMNDIQQEGGGILFLVGSAGDGKSHMISTLNKEYPDFMFKNDASESPWPTVDSIDALKIFLADFKTIFLDYISRSLSCKSLEGLDNVLPVPIYVQMVGIH